MRTWDDNEEDHASLALSRREVVVGLADGHHGDGEGDLENDIPHHLHDRERKAIETESVCVSARSL